MTRNVDHVIDATGDPVIAIGIPPRAIAGEILAFVAAEIGLEKPRMVAPDGPHLAWPRSGDHQIAFSRAVQHVPVGIADLKLDPEQRQCSRARSDERRGGTECVVKCRSWGSP